MARDGWASVAVLLRADEAAAVAGLLRSACIEGAGSAGLFPVAGDLGGAEVRVPDGDAARAREIVAASGLLAGAQDAASAPGEASESEWSAPPRPADPGEPAADDRPRAPGAGAVFPEVGTGITRAGSPGTPSSGVGQRSGEAPRNETAGTCACAQGIPSRGRDPRAAIPR